MIERSVVWTGNHFGGEAAAGGLFQRWYIDGEKFRLTNFNGKVCMCAPMSENGPDLEAERLASRVAVAHDGLHNGQGCITLTAKRHERVTQAVKANLYHGPSTAFHVRTGSLLPDLYLAFF